MKKKLVKRLMRILIFIGALFPAVCAEKLRCISQSNPLGRYSIEAAGSGGIGDIWSGGISSGSRIRVSARCDQGFIAQPSVNTRCKNGTWSKLWPQCVQGLLNVSPNNASLYVGDDHTFQCSPKATTWIVSWEKDGQRIDSNVTAEGDLILKAIQVEDDGKYTCVVRNRLGRIKIRADAWLHVIPRIDISTVCGTVTFWKENKDPLTMEPEESSDTEANEDNPSSIVWSSSSVINDAKKISGHVVGGYQTKNGSAPFMVGIWKRNWQDWDFHCGGSLLDQRWILTAAHCMYDYFNNKLHKEELKLIFGDFDTLTTDFSEKTRKVSEIIIHEDYDHDDELTLDNDIALIRIDPPLREFTPYIRPICLAPVALSRHLTEGGTFGRATGWGRISYRGILSRFLKAVELPVVDRQTCRESVKKGQLTDNMFCAGYHQGGQDSCNGDSGGPFAVRHDDGRWYLLGIVSWGTGCARRGEYGFYTHVSRYLQWIGANNVTLAYSRQVARKFNENNNCNALVFRVRSAAQLNVSEGSEVNLKCVPNVDEASVQWYIGNDQEESRHQNSLQNCNPDAIFTDGREGTNVTWFKDGQRLSSGDIQGIVVDQYNRLLIPNFDPRYEGHYACVVHSWDRESFRSETNISIHRQVTVPPSTAVALGDDVSLVCTTLQSRSTFIWTYVTAGHPLYVGTIRAMALPRYDNIVLQESTDPHRSVLNVNAIELEDEGEYRCGITTQTADFPVTLVTVEVASVRKEIDLISIDGDTIYQATCDAIGSKPEETITWILDGVVQSNGIVETDPGISADPLVDKRSVFTFPASPYNTNVELECVISGHLVPELNRRESRLVDIHREISSDCDLDLTFTEEPQDVHAAEGDLIELRCQVNYEDTTIIWFKGRRRLNAGIPNGIFIDQFNQLLIPSFNEIHGGRYACVVLLDDRECLRSEANITFNPIGFYSTTPLDAHIEVGSNHLFLCSPREEAWRVSWEKDDQPLENAFTVRGNLVLSDIREEDEGKYTCVLRDPFNRTRGRIDAWLNLTSPQIDISTVCGTITYWRQNNARPDPTPEESTGPDGSKPSIIWSSSLESTGPDGSEPSISWSSAYDAPRIVGGFSVDHGSAPYVVRILEFRDLEWTTICGGTLVDQRWIMTAANCMLDGHGNLFNKENLLLMFGDYDTLVIEDSEIGRSPAEIIVHEDFDRRTFDNDIALIRIEPPLRKFTPYIRPICLAPIGLSSRLMKPGKLGRVTGWGQPGSFSVSSRFLTEVEIPFVDRQTCQASVYGLEFTDSMFCAGYHSAQRDACRGDSGGPFVVRHDDGRWYQLGIISWGIGCAEEGEYGFYTHVSRFLHWIRSKNVTVAYSPEVARNFPVNH